MEWTALVIPLLIAMILRAWWDHKVTWWELAMPFCLSVFLILGGKAGSDSIQVSDTEYWTGWITRADYDDEDTYWVTVTDSDGNSHMEQRTDPPSWRMTDNNGIGRSITRKRYAWFVKQFGNEKGFSDKYTVFNGGRNDMVPFTTTHTYENRTQVSKNVFNFEDVENPEELGLFDYPEIKSSLSVPSILGDGGPTMESANKELTLRNAELGKKKQIRMWILVFKNKPFQTAIDQESHWKGGNKNELVLCIGVNDDYSVKWSYVFSWTDDEYLKIWVRSHPRMPRMDKSKSLDLNSTVASMSNLAEARWVRKQFADFSYLKVPLPLWAILTIYGIVLAGNIGCCFFAICNQCDPEERKEKLRPRWRKRR